MFDRLLISVRVHFQRLFMGIRDCILFYNMYSHNIYYANSSMETKQSVFSRCMNDLLFSVGFSCVVLYTDRKFINGVRTLSDTRIINNYLLALEHQNK